MSYISPVIFDFYTQLNFTNQLNGYNEDNDLITEYYECLVECDDNQAECKDM